MDNITVLVLVKITPTANWRCWSACRARHPSPWKQPEAFARLAPEARVILNWSGTGKLLEQVWKMAPRAEWVHSRAAGLDGTLFPRWWRARRG